MFKGYKKYRVQIENALNKLKETERNKKRRLKMLGFLLSEDEKELLDEVLATLSIVMTGSQLICGNDATLSAADRVSTWQGVTELHLSSFHSICH